LKKPKKNAIGEGGTGLFQIFREIWGKRRRKLLAMGKPWRGHDSQLRGGEAKEIKGGGG